MHFQINNKAKPHLIINMKYLEWQKIINPMTLNHQVLKIKLEIKTRKSRNHKFQIKHYKSKEIPISLIHSETIMEMQKFLKNLLGIVTKKKKRNKTRIKVNIK
jgi:hypothetical protein